MGGIATVGPFLKDNVTRPLGAEYYIGGMDEQQQAHVAEVLPNTGARLFAAKDAAIPDKPDTPEGWQDGAVLRSFAFLQNPAEPWHTTMNSPVWRPARSPCQARQCPRVARIYGRRWARWTGSLMSKSGSRR
jgi:hypothetical protein